MNETSDFERLVTRLGDEGRSRFPRWDAAMWRSVLEGPAAALAGKMESAGRSAPEVAAVLESYLYPAREAVGMGYLYPDSAGRRNFFSIAWNDMMPRDLPAMSAARAAEVVAACWNVGENLEKAEPWVSGVFMNAAAGAMSLDSIESTVETVLNGLFEPPSETLSDDSFSTGLVMTASIDHSFLPGRIRFIAPLVIEVSDRSKGVEGKPRAAQVIWLKDPPVLLGPTPPSGAPEPAADERDPIWELAARKDRRITGIISSARNEWRAAASMATSQMVAVAMPATGR